jgi:hypothetical protein
VRQARAGLPAHSNVKSSVNRCKTASNTTPPRENCRGGVATSPSRRYFFFAAFIVPDPQEDLLLFVDFFDMHAIAVPPLKRW